jgi:hypothetical protein
MDFYDYNTVTIAHSPLDEDWIIRDIPGKKRNRNLSEKTRRIDTSKTIEEMVDLCNKNAKLDKKDFYLKSREPNLREKELHFSFWHVFTFSPLNTLPIDTEFHVRKYSCTKNAQILTILEEKHYEKLLGKCIRYTPNGANLDELQLVSQFTIPSPVKPCDLPKELLPIIKELSCIKLQEPYSCVPFNGQADRSHYLTEFRARCENLIKAEARSIQPDENPHVASKRKQK